MKIIEAGFERITEVNPIKKIERIARVCYKSEDNITEESAVTMVKMLLKRNHLAMLEHSTLVFEVSEIVYYDVMELLGDYMHFIMIKSERNRIEELCTIPKLRYTECNLGNDTRYIVSGNLRAWFEFFEWIEKYSLQGWKGSVYCLHGMVYNETIGLISFRERPRFNETDKCVMNGKHKAALITDCTILTAQERMVHETMSLLFTVDRGITHEIIRMRECSFAQESTRYCNYSKGKFGTEITVIKPYFWSEDSLEYKSWLRSCQLAENEYIYLTKELGVSPQLARDILPTSIKADIVVTTNLLEWKHIFNLRACDATGPAHPQMKEVMIPALLSVKDEYSFAFGDLIPATT